MATDFWASSHYKRWIVTRAALIQARAEDARYVDRAEYLDYLGIYFANVITKLGKKLQFRQRVIATATVFFRRFYLKNSYCDTDPFIVIAACCYVAAKAEEYPVHIKVIVSESRALFSQDMYGVKNFPSDNTKIAEMEFYLVNDLECDLIVFHPYRTLLTLCKRQSTQGASPSSEEGEADDLGIGVGADDGPRYWGTGEGQLELTPSALQTAWSIINDTYRSQLCVLYPPHLIAIAAIYLTFILHPPPRPDLETSDSTDPSNSTYDQSALNTKAPRRSSRHSQSSATQSKKTTQDPINFFADLNVSLPLIATIAQEIISLYTLWGRYKEDLAPEHHKYSNRDTSATNASSPLNSATNSTTASPMKRSRSSRTTSGPVQISVPGMSNLTPIIILDDHDNTPTASGSPADSMSANTPGGPGAGGLGNTSGALSPGAGSVTAFFLSAVLRRMRENRLMDIARSMAGGGGGDGHVHGGMSGIGQISGGGGSSGMQTQGARAINKRLERTQAAG